jgi:hypothetical protein
MYVTLKIVFNSKINQILLPTVKSRLFSCQILPNSGRFFFSRYKKPTELLSDTGDNGFAQGVYYNYGVIFFEQGIEYE